MSWRARPICMRCQRIIHGPGTGVAGPRACETSADGDVQWFYGPHGCALCRMPASPYNIMRLWADEDEPDEGLEWADERMTPAEPMAVFIPKEEL